MIKKLKLYRDKEGKPVFMIRETDGKNTLYEDLIEVQRIYEKNKDVKGIIEINQ